MNDLAQLEMYLFSLEYPKKLKISIRDEESDIQYDYETVLVNDRWLLSTI